MAIPVPEAALRDHKTAQAQMSPEAIAHQAQAHQQVGRLVAAWACCESVYCALLERLLDTTYENTLIVFYSISNNRARMNLVAALAKQNLTGTTQARALKLVERFKAPTALRNELAHSEYAYDPTTLAFMGNFTANIQKAGAAGGIGQFKPYSKGRVNELNHVTAALNELSVDLWKFCRDLDAAKLRDQGDAGAA